MNKKIRIIVGCEFSQVVTKAFRDRGHEAFSCDILPTEGNPNWHFQEDILKLLKKEKFDLGIFFPPCTHLASSGARWFKEKRKDGRQQQGIDFFMKLINAPIEKIAVENPIGIMSTIYRKPNQIIQPWMFGHNETKATCLWLKGLSILKPENIVEPDYMRKADGTYYKDKKGKRYSRIHFMSRNIKDRGKERSRTFQGIGNAFANQWSNI